jgi:uncharacterized membrane protein YfcA
VFEPLDVSVLEFVLCAVAASAGAVVQGAIGFGYALVVVPTLLIVAPAAIPVTPLTVATPMVFVQAIAERRALDLAGFARLTAGRLPGTALGAWVLTVAGTRFVAGAAGALLLAAVAASAVSGARTTSPRMEVAAGFASGVAGTVGAVGGPYMGLAYADRPGPVLRATVSLAFAVGVVISLAAVGIAGEITEGAVLLGVALVPTTFAGLLLGRRVTGLLDGGWLRPCVLGFAGAAGVFALVRALA